MSGTAEFISGLKQDDIPWERLVSTYGWASDFSALLERVSCGTADEALSALDTLAGEIAHQDTLWPCTPFALVFLVRALKEVRTRQNSHAAFRIIEILTDIAEVCAWAFSLEHADPLPCFADMLDERHLPPSGEKEPLTEEDFGFSDELFFSFYHYSYEVLRTASDICRQPLCGELQYAAELFLDAFGGCAVS